ncbi:MAG TPA: sulfite exporter TauE/SafE family protein [Candidatus Hypogeohydataceae bacterium YC41]
MEEIFSFTFLFAVLAGLAIGILAGLTGMPLGALRLPAVYVMVPTSYVAAGTNLGIDTLASLTGSYRYWKGGKIEPWIFLFMGSFSCIGAFLGGYFSRCLPHKWFLLVIGIVYLYSGLSMLWVTISGVSTSGGEESVPEGKKWAGASALWGFILGFIGGMVGLLMGSLRVPVMIRSMGLAPALAAGTNIAISSLTALSGFLGHCLQRNFDVTVLLIMGLASMAGAYLGSHLAINLSPLALKRLISSAIILMATTLILKSLRM